MNGLSLVSNLEEFKAQSDALVELSKKPLETDQDFANAESRQKVFTKAEADIKALADRVLGEVADIDAFTKDLRYIGEQIRQARLAEGKQIKSRKEEIKKAIAIAARDETLKFGIELFSQIKLSTPLINISIDDAMKNKRTIDSLRDAADTAVAQIKIELTQQYKIASANLETLKELASDYKFLFSDWKDIAFKSGEDFTAIVKSRISEHKAEEEKRAEEQRERIRAEERAKAEREAQAKIDAERKESEAQRLAEIATTNQVESQERPDYLTNPTSKPVHADKEVTPAQLTDYQRGYLDGLKAYAWWKNGVQYVGTCDQTLDAATSLFLAKRDAA